MISLTLRLAPVCPVCSPSLWIQQSLKVEQADLCTVPGAA